MNNLAIAPDKGRVGFLTCRNVFPSRDTVFGDSVQVLPGLNVAGGSVAPDQAFQLRGAGQAVGAVYPGTGNFTRGIEAVNSGLPPAVHEYAAAKIMRCGHHRNGLACHINPGFETGGINGWKSFSDLIAVHV